MARVSTYLNFDGDAEAAFNHYRSVFGSDFSTPIMRFADMPPQPGGGPVPDDVKQLVMHVSLPILGGHTLMGSDSPASMGMSYQAGNNVHISLEPDTRAEADRLFAALSKGGSVEMPMADMFWGDYFGSLTDAYGIHWMLNCTQKAA